MADKTRNDTTEGTRTDATEADDAQSERPKWLIDELSHYLPGVDISTMSDSEVEAALKKYVDKFHLGQYGDLIDDPALLDTLKKDATKERLGQYGDRVDDPRLKEALEREAEKQRLGDFGDLVDDPGLKEALEKEADRQRLGDVEPDLDMPVDAGTDDPMNPKNVIDWDAPPTKTPEQHQDERLQKKLEDDPRNSSTTGQSGSGSTPTSGNGQSASDSGQSGGLGGSTSDTQGHLPGTSAASGNSGDSTSGGSVTPAAAGGTTGPAASGTANATPGPPAPAPKGEVSTDEYLVKDGDGKWSVVFPDNDASEGSATADADTGSDADADGSQEGNNDADSSADPPPDGDDGTDLEYTPSGEGKVLPGTAGHARFEHLTDDYIAYRDAVRGSATINPEREGSNDAVGDSSSGKSLTGSDGDTRYDDIATETAGGSQAGRGFGKSQGAGAITYGPDSDVDFGVGPEDDVPVIDGPPTDLSHLADSITGQRDGTESKSSALPGNISPSDLKIEDGAPEGLDRAGIIRPIISEPVQYVTGDLHSASGSGGDPQPEPQDFDLIGEIARDTQRPEMIRQIPVDHEDDDSGQPAGKDVEIPVVDLDPGSSGDPRRATIDARENEALESKFLEPIIGTAIDPAPVTHRPEATSDVTEEGWYTIPQQPDSPFDDTRVTLDASEISDPVREVPTSFEPIDFASAPDAFNKHDSGGTDSRLEPLSFDQVSAVEPVTTDVTRVSDNVTPTFTMSNEAVPADPLIPDATNPNGFKVETGNLPAIEPTLPVDHGYLLNAPVDASDEEDDPGE